jgi:CheY-like chemotaxis protein
MENPEKSSGHNSLATQSSKKSILVIDDCLDLLSLLQTILEIDDYEIFTAQSGGEAFKLLAEINKPDLIFLDMKMDDMSGHDFLKILDEEWPEIIDTVPVVFLTAMDNVTKGKAAGYIHKPISDVNTFLKDTQAFIELGAGHARYAN